MAETASTVPRRQLGRYLRELRQQSGMTIAEVARRIERGATTVQRLETGQADRIRMWDIEALCQVLGAGETETAALKGLAQQGNTKSWWHEYGDLIPQNFDVYMGLESASASFTSFQELVPGLAQTPDCARVLMRTVHPGESGSEIDRRVEMRMHRQILITRHSKPLSVTMILDESVLHRVIGSAKIMATQLRHLADLSTKPNVAIRILPYSAGVPLGDLTGPFIILDFDDDDTGQSFEPPVVYVESYTGAMYFDDRDSVQRYRTAHETMWQVALDASRSRDLLRRASKDI
ncbi:helix-turn-helix domain-containing protein [Nocardia sp. SYP-A9097]|uniref:helix-turn-helix domain-containing protein n=1 Tax=Nocardia sp. SYP-A9097 TaxID=2663237 RepID=UPI00129B6165|nr:helix-turn-helix transcriptional regulator [Nocardia sp. SYP-A9097]MRH91529.1 helix-turn-helix domain-containing protein [Nocardia sp. SYP-A9097]